MSDLKLNRHDLKLLYRGSRDGFAAINFHSKCDNQANTVTVIETTSGFIFGGYTQAKWASNYQNCYDTNAYLFSLVNPFKKPFFSKVFDSSYAIYNDPNYGPIFGGGHDIFVNNNSNLSPSSYIKLTNFHKPNDINDPKGFYFCDNRNFLVKEIEVFQIESR